MKKTPKTSAPHAWVNLMRLVDEVEERHGYSSLDRVSKRVLEWISTESKPDAPLYVWVIISKSEIASPATIHKSLMILRRRELISVTKDETDSRKRLVCMTRKGRVLLERLFQDVVQGLKESPLK